MYTTLNKVAASLPHGIVHYAYGILCYQCMGVSPEASDQFLLSLLATESDADVNESSTEKRARHAKLSITDL